MRLGISILILAFAPGVALADLGDTMAQSELKYGESSPTGSPQILVYTHPPFRIWQTFDDNGICVIAEFSPLDRTAPFTAVQCAELDRNNLPVGLELGVGPGWELVPWSGGARGRNTVSYQHTALDGILFQVVVGQSRDDETAPWHDDRLYLSDAGIKMMQAFGQSR
jgi:hypothetical protein